MRAFKLADIPGAADPSRHLKELLAGRRIASKNWVYRQYDHMVRDGTVVCPGSDAAVLRIKADSLPESANARIATSLPGGGPAEKLIALSVDCNATYVYLDPYEGAKIGRGGSGAKPGLHRRGAAGRHGQPEFRQSVESGDFLAVTRSSARAWRRLPRVQRSGHGRQRQPV